MKRMRLAAGALVYRVWIVQYANWQPATWRDVPIQFTALEPAEEACLSAEEAARFVEGFNQAMLAAPRQIWAIAVPATIRYEGDLEPGGTFGSSACLSPESQEESQELSR